MAEGDRVLEVIEKYFDGSRRMFAEAMKLDTGQLSRVISNKETMPKRCNQLLRARNINPEYIRNGTGTVLINSSIVMEPGVIYHSIIGGDAGPTTVPVEVVQSLKEQVDILRKNNDHLIEQNNKLVNAIIERVK